MSEVDELRCTAPGCDWRASVPASAVMFPRHRCARVTPSAEGRSRVSTWPIVATRYPAARREAAEQIAKRITG